MRFYVYKYQLFLFLVLAIQIVKAQGTTLYFQEYLSENLYLIHPAMAGVNLNNTRFNFGSRSQWLGVDKSPSTQFSTIEYQANSQSTIGIKLYNDRNGYHNQKAIYITYVFRIYLNDEIWKTRRAYPTKNDEFQEISFGLSLGNQSRNLDSSSWQIQNNDPLISANDTANGFMGINVGVAYVTNNISAQFSIHNIAVKPNQNNLLYDELVFDTVGHKHILASLQYEIFTDSGWNFEPSLLMQYLEKTEESSWDASFKIFRLFGKGRAWLGISYRQNNIGVDLRYNDVSQTQYNRNCTPLVGLNYNKFKFSYQYSLPLGAFNFGKGGVHFVNLGFQP